MLEMFKMLEIEKSYKSINIWQNISLKRPICYISI